MIVEVILTVVMVCVCVAALTVSLINRKRVGCQKPNCNCTTDNIDLSSFRGII